MLLQTFIFTLSIAFLQASRTYTDVSVLPLTPAEGIAIKSLTSPDQLGFSVKNAGDFNEDGFDDVLIGSSNAAGGVGAAYVIFGSNTSLSDLTVTSGITASQGMTITGSSLERLGYSVSFAGDVNSDGIDDIIIGGTTYSTSTGVVWVIYGSRTPPATLDLSSGLTTSQGYKITGASSYNFFGSSVSYAGDVNKDGIDDVIIGANGASGFQGAAYVIFGQAGTTRSGFDLASALSPTDGFQILGPPGTGFFGTSVSDAGDIDGDGIDDIILGAYGKDSAYIIYGKDTSVSGAFSTIDLSAGLSLSQGFTIIGATSGSKFGISVSKAGDFNGDGRADVIIGASGEDAAYVIFGNARSALSDLSLSSGISSARGIKIQGTAVSSGFGGSVSGAGDINGDNIDDILIGASQANSAYVIFGSANLASDIDLSSGFDGQEGYVIIGDPSGDLFGAAVSMTGDVNGDGMKDLIVGAYGASSSAGAAYLLFTPVVCPIRCLTCQTTSICLSCNTGYGLYNSQCVVCPSSTNLINGICVPKTSLGTTAEVATGLFNSGSTASRLFTMGRSLSVGLGLMAKIIQNVRFLAIDYPEDALSAFQTYGTDLFELPIPGAFYKSPATKQLSSQYSRYDMEPSFLENYWDTIMMMLICLGCFFVIKFGQFLMKTQRKDHIVQVILKNIGQTFANYFIVQIYSNLDDVTFYLYLDVKSTELSSPSAGISLAAAIFFLLLGLFLVCFHCWLLGKYQQAKSEGALERFEVKYRILGTLYDDFKDYNIAKQCFFGILILRCVILILIITLLQSPWLQAILMMLANLSFLAYLIYHRPFKSLFDEITQYFCELTIFAAYLSVLILSILTAGNPSLRNGLGKCIVIAGIVLALGGFIVQVIQIIGAIIGMWKFLKGYNKKKSKVKISPSPTIDLGQNPQNSGTRASESSMILRPSNLDQLELMSTSYQRNTRPLKKVPFGNNDLRASVTNPVMRRRISPGIMKPNREGSERVSEAQRNQVFPGPLGSQLYREPRQERHVNLGFGSLNSQRHTENNPELRRQGNRNPEAKKRRIKRAERERRTLNFSGENDDII